MAVKDLSTMHMLISDLFRWPRDEDEWKELALTQEQVEFFDQNGFLPGIRMLDDDQIARLRAELREVADPKHPGHELFYEFHSNESTDPSRILFHALGAWRISEGLHDVLWNPRFIVAAS